MKKTLLGLLVVFALTGCMTSRFPMTSQDQIPEKPTYSRTQHFVWINKVSTVDPAKVCGSVSNVAMVEDVVLTHQAWLKILTALIYQPTTTRVYCKRPVRNGYIAPQPSSRR
mgnify:FL=1